MTAPLFEMGDPDSGRVPQRCDRCLSVSRLTDDGLRVGGWIVFDGFSLTGRPMRVRICPLCRRGPRS